ncbi:Crp/Fnr family transcriptional regulator [Streptomyces olivochromogenes]|uniref:Crp/Fnr family transcriptional regulator n=1 Tax=Streptomyces olivochromogenes TaxID=1963 RepID=UPI001F2A268C|nr:Crp/Fnr family transcriptional regulator [Streptomyces olivochromogenes]MCF3130382.1 Crp/Fnr family transcriptional regulator [Streptomyces olivochromogenes]
MHVQSSGRVRAATGGRWPQGTLMVNLAADDREALLSLGRTVRYETGDVLIREGSSDTTVLLLLDGCVKVVGVAEDGGITLLALRVRGELVGEVSALDGQPRSATVIAARPTVTRAITGAVFRDFLRERRGAADVVQRSVLGKLRGATRYRIDGSSGTAAVRLARALDNLVRSYARAVPEGLRIDVPLSHSDLAALASVSEASVQRALRSLRAAGAVTTKYRMVVIRDADILRAIAGQSGWPAVDGPDVTAAPRQPRPPRPKRATPTSPSAAEPVRVESGVGEGDPLSEAG